MHLYFSILVKENFLFHFFGKLQLISFNLLCLFNCIYSQLSYYQSTRQSKPTRGSEQPGRTIAKPSWNGNSGSTNPCSAAAWNTNWIRRITCRYGFSFPVQSSRTSGIRTPPPTKTDNTGAERVESTRQSLATAEPSTRHDSLPG